MKRAAPRPISSWVLVSVALVYMGIGLALIVVSVMYIRGVGWLGVGGVLVGLSAVGASTMAIVKNDPSWILLDLLFPFP
jgi:hypothetical protein